MARHTSVSYDRYRGHNGVFQNILKVPGFDQNHQHTKQELEAYIRDQATLLLPFATLLEAGNHIAQLSDGGQRRKYAETYQEQVRLAVDGTAPWRPIAPPDLDAVRRWLEQFPDGCMRGLGISDVSIVEEWEQTRVRHAQTRVRIWSLDAHLSGYDRSP